MTARHLLKASLLATTISLLTACGDDGDSTTPATGAPAAAASVGVLTDAAVGGVAYATAPSNLSGTTTAKGEYQFRAGDTVTFTLGGSTLQVPATGRITPATIAAHLFSGDDAKIANATTNLAVLFQTLDADNNPGNGITVDGSITLTGFTPATALAQALVLCQCRVAAGQRAAQALQVGGNGGGQVGIHAQASLRAASSESRVARQAALQSVRASRPAAVVR